MPVEPKHRPDEHLLRNLEAFGRTLQATMDDDITSPGITEVEVLPGPPEVESSPPTSYRRWILAVAAALAVVAISAVVVLSVFDGRSSTDPADPDHSTTTEVDTDEDARIDADGDLDDATFVPAGPSVVTASDGTPIGQIDWNAATREVIYVHINDGGLFHTSYVDTTVGALLADRDRLTALGWRSDLIDEDGSAMTAQNWLARSGLTITTNLDRDLTRLAADTVAATPVVDAGFDASVITVEPSGAVLVHETTYETSYWHSTLSERNPGGSITASSPLDDDAYRCCDLSPGSAFKPIVLTAAFEQGAIPDDVIAASGPCTFDIEPYGVYTVGGSFQQPASLAAVTRSSNNCAYVRLGLAVGTAAIVDTAGRLGLTELPSTVDGPVPALPLGVWPVDAVELTGTYATIANEGRLVEPRFIARITGPDGRTLFRTPDDVGAGEQVINPGTAGRVIEVLTSVVDRGTGTNARLDDRPVAGKTGTTNDFTAAWFIGSTTAYTTTVWIGDNELGVGFVTDEQWRPIVIDGYGTVFGGELPAQIWHDYMEPAHAGIDPTGFPKPAAPDREPRLIEVDEERNGEP